jgi:hypothetical protein
VPDEFSILRPPHAINVGPWKYARYPNYGGEILQWWGLWLLSIAVLSGAYWICIVSPLFLMCLLLFVSGVPLQEKQASGLHDPIPTPRTQCAFLTCLLFFVSISLVKVNQGGPPFSLVARSTRFPPSHTAEQQLT